MSDAPAIPTAAWDDAPRASVGGRTVSAPLPAALPALIVDVDGFEGPLDLLLMLSRSLKVDLRRISVLQLAEQYLAFIGQAQNLRIELAADYLVMAAWLAFLKSRLLLPPDPADDGPSGEDMAAHLAFQLERLQAMREAAAALMARDRLGREVFARGLPQDVQHIRSVRHRATLLDLMQAYARLRTRDDFRPFALDRVHLCTLQQALDHLRGLIGFAGDWADLSGFLPPGWDDCGERHRSAVAATFCAALELAKRGEISLRQDGASEPLRVRARAG